MLSLTGGIEVTVRAPSYRHKTPEASKASTTETSQAWDHFIYRSCPSPVHATSCNVSFCWLAVRGKNSGRKKHRRSLPFQTWSASCVMKQQKLLVASRIWQSHCSSLKNAHEVPGVILRVISPQNRLSTRHGSVTIYTIWMTRMAIHAAPTSTRCVTFSLWKTKRTLISCHILFCTSRLG